MPRLFRLWLEQWLTTSGIPFLNSAMVTDPQWGQLGGCVPSNQMAGQAPINLLPFTWIVKLLPFTWILYCFNQPGKLGYSYSPEQLFKSDLLLQAWWLWLQYNPCLWLKQLSRHSLSGFCQKWSFHWNASLPLKQFRQCSDFGSQTPHDICGHGSHYTGSLPSPTNIALI